MIRINITLKNGQVLGMTLEDGSKLPGFVKTNRAAACWLLEQGTDASEMVTFRNAGAAFDSFAPAKVGSWARGNKLFGDSKAPKEHLRDEWKAQALPGKPRKGTLCAAVWEMLDELGNVSNAVAIAAGASRGLNAGNVRVEASRWRRYHALKAARA